MPEELRRDEPFPPTRTTGGEQTPTPTGQIDKAEAAANRRRAAANDPRHLPATTRITLTAADVRLKRQVSFRVHSCTVDNWTDQWVFVHGVDRFVPPQSGGIVFIMGGTQAFDVEFAAPPGNVQPAAVAAQQVTFDLSEERADLRSGA